MQFAVHYPAHLILSGTFLCGPPPLAAGSLQPVGNDPYTFKLKTAWSDGTTHLLLSGMEVVEKLAALVPPPRQHLVRYHGVLAPNAKLRKQIAPQMK